jgi:hypothetical protein
MFETLATFQPPIFALNADADWNMEAMLVTLTVFHLLMSALNVGRLLNSKYMFDTALVSQLAMFPYIAVAVVGSLTQANTAVPMFASVRL